MTSWSHRLTYAAVILRSGAFWWIALAVYGALVVTIALPVLVTSVGADDRFWLFDATVDYHGSPLAAFFSAFPDILSGETLQQPRNTQLSVGVRRGLAVIVLESARFFSVPVAVPWAILKLALLALTVGGFIVVIRQWRMRRRDGSVSTLSRASVAFVAISLPLGIAVGVKADSFNLLNGWLHYPILTYGAAPFILGVVALTLGSVRLLNGNFRRWIVPVALWLSLVAIIVNFSYELVLVAIPLAAGAVFLQAGEGPRPWRSKITTAGILTGVFLVIFVVNRVRAALAPCHAEGTCYEGTSFEINVTTIVNNFFAAFPVAHDPRAVADAVDIGGSVPLGATAAGVALALAAIVAWIAVWSSWKARHPELAAAGLDSQPTDTRPLLATAALGIALALSISVLAAITVRATEVVLYPTIAYRSGPAAWAGVALAVIALARLVHLWLRPRGWLAAIPVAVMLTAAALAISANFSTNAHLARIEREKPITTTTDQLAWEVVLGERGDAGDLRRCAAAAAYVEATPPISYHHRVLVAAYAAYEQFHHDEFCSTGEGLDRELEPAG